MNHRLEYRRGLRPGSLLAAGCLLGVVWAAAAWGQKRGSPEDYQARSNWLTRYMAGEIGWTSQTLEALAALAETMPELPIWRHLGPIDYIPGRTIDNSNSRLGRVSTLAFHPSDPNVLYAGTPNSGLWQGQWLQGRMEWRSITTPAQIRKYPSLLAISGVAVDPENTGQIYVLTGDGIGGVSGLPAVPSFGVMKSADGGESWQPTALRDTWDANDAPYWGFKLVMDPCESGVLFAVTNNGLYRTEDGGDNWDSVQAGFYRDLDFQRTQEECSGATAVLHAATLTGVYRSEDGGESWQESEISLHDAHAEEAPTNDSFIELAVTPAAPQYVYAVAGTSERGLTGFYRSEDGGKTYPLRVVAPNILGDRFMGDKFGSLAYFGGTLAVSPLDPEDVFLGRMNTWRSGDGGRTWCLSSFWELQPAAHPPYLHADVHMLGLRRVERSDRNAYDLYAATDGGVFRAQKATDSPVEPAVCGLDWKDLSPGLRITQTFRICATPSDPSLVYLGSQDNGTFRLGGPRQCHGRPLASERTACSVSNGDGGTCLIHPGNSAVVYVSKQRGRIFKSTDGGERVVSVGPPVSSVGLNQQYLTPLAMDPFEPDTLYACYDDLWKTADGGRNWENLSQGRIGADICTGIAVAGHSREQPRVIYAAKRGTGHKLPLIFWSRDDGTSWRGRTIPEAGSASGVVGGITGVVTDAGDPHRAWITSSTSGAGSRFEVYALETDLGALRELEHGLAAPREVEPLIYFARATCIAHAGKTRRGHDRLFVGTQVGVFYGECGEASCHWLPFIHLPLMILDLEVVLGADQRPERLLAATYGQGVWSLEIPLLAKEIGKASKRIRRHRSSSRTYEP